MDYTQVDVVFHLRQEDLEDCATDKLTYADVLLVHFSTGAKQVHVHYMFNDSAITQSTKGWNCFTTCTICRSFN